jgi:hypothetical protein
MRNAVITLAVLCLAAQCFSDDKQAVTLDQLLSKHVASVGTAQALAAVRGRGVEASTRFTIRQGGSGGGEGSAKFGSAGAKTRFNLRIQSSNYGGEDFVCDGNKVQVARLVSGNTALLGAFFYDKQFLLKEGIFGGVLSTAWPMLQPKAVAPKLKYSGLKKIDGRELLEVRYEPKEFYPGLDVRLYFDPETFHHVLTVYEWHVRSDLGGDAVGGRGRSVANDSEQAVETLRESFSDFRSADGVIVPAHWTVELSKESQVSKDANSASKLSWDFSVTNVVHTDLDAAMFKVK